MLKRFKIGTGAVLGLAALAVGGSAVAGATSSTHAKKASLVSMSAAEPKATGRDTDNVQSGDQTAPDSATASKASKASKASDSSTSESSAPSDGPGGHADAPGNVDNQSGDQNTPDSAKASKASESNTSESSSESSKSESSAPSDGPGGHADPAGNADNQQQGQN